MKISKTTIAKWLPHALGLLLFSILPLFVFDRENNRAIYWIYSYYYQLVFMIIAFYVNYLIIVPRFFFSKKKVHFFSILILFTIVLVLLSQYIYGILQLEILRPTIEINGKLIRPGRNQHLGLHPKLIDNFFLMIVVLGFSSGMAIIQRFRQNEDKQKEIEKARVDSELAFLKNQVSPHFFFNALNNIYGLIALDQDKAQKSVEKLSGLMRYLIYESNIETIALQKEFDFTQKYIELMRERLSSKINLDINISNKIPEGQIPPLLFIPFVENAFKHGVSYREDSFIYINLEVLNNKVVFDCKNSIPGNNNRQEKDSGVGISNIIQRLELIYDDTYDLKIDETSTEYAVHLVVPIY